MIARAIEATANFGNNIIDVNTDIVITIHHSEFPEYSGVTEFTPTSETQIIPTNGTVLLSDITINPIPSNYGLITWDGTTLKIS